LLILYNKIFNYTFPLLGEKAQVNRWAEDNTCELGYKALIMFGKISFHKIANHWLLVISH